MSTKKPEEVLAEIKQAAKDGKVEFASDVLAAALNEEIQKIFSTIKMIETGNPPKRPLWTADGIQIGIIMELDENGRPTQKARQIIEQVSLILGISLSTKDTWEEAALRLRDKESHARN